MGDRAIPTISQPRRGRRVQNGLWASASELFSLLLILALVAAGALGCETSTTSNQGGAEPAASEVEWVQLDAPPIFGGLEAVPEGAAIRVENGPPDAVISRALIVPENDSLRLEWAAAGHPLSLCDVVVSGVHYSFGTVFGGGVISFPAGGADLEEAYASVGGGGLPPSAVWFRRGDQYKATFVVEADDVVGAIGAVHEARQDPRTGLLSWERLSRADPGPTGEEPRVLAEVSRELVPLSDVEEPAVSDVYEFAERYWNDQVQALKQASFDCFGVDLPGLSLTGASIGELDGTGGLIMATLTYSLKWAESPSPGMDLTALVITMYPDDPKRDPELSEVLLGFARGSGGESTILTRGGTIIGINITPFANLPSGSSPQPVISLDTVTLALVPVTRLPDEHFALPASYVR